MWNSEKETTTTASPEQVWAIYTDTPNRLAWEVGIESVALDGPFEVGTTGKIAPTGRPPREFTIVDCVPNVSFADESRFGPIVVRLTHSLEALAGGGTKIVHGVVVDGSADDEAVIGPRIAGDFEPTLARLVALAEA